MNQEAQIELDRILAIDPAARTESENAFLAARSEYHDEKIESNEPEKVDYKKLNKADLQKALRERGIEFDENAKNAVLVKMLEISDEGLTPHVVTQEDLEKNPDLLVEVGEVIGLPVASGDIPNV